MLKVKEWKYDDMMKKVCNYGDKWMDIDYFERENTVRNYVVVDEDKYVHYNGPFEIIKETAKAVQISFRSGEWTEWMPKSAILIA